MKKDGDTALMIAIKFARGTSAHIPILLGSKGIDLEVRNKAGQTALMVAVGMGRQDIVNQLLLAGAEASAVIKSSYTAESSVSVVTHLTVSRHKGAFNLFISKYTFGMNFVMLFIIRSRYQEQEGPSGKRRDSAACGSRAGQHRCG